MCVTPKGRQVQLERHHFKCVRLLGEVLWICLLKLPACEAPMNAATAVRMTRGSCAAVTMERYLQRSLDDASARVTLASNDWLKTDRDDPVELNLQRPRPGVNPI